MPFVNIRIVKDVIASDPEGKKTAITADIVKAITRSTGLTPDDIWVVFEEVASRDWYVGATSVEKRRAK